MLLLSLFTLLILAIPSISAELEIVSKNDCLIELKGKIDKGDSAKLATLVKDTKIGNYEALSTSISEVALCLDSEGGSYSEARKLASIIHGVGIPTYIEKNAECLSACAYLFMAGRFLGNEIDGPSRVLEVKGKLGFHAPYFEEEVLAKKEYSPNDVLSYMELSNAIVADMIEFSNNRTAYEHSTLFKSSLIAELLKKKRSEFVYVDTVEAAGRWGIEISGASYPDVLTEDHYVQACTNFHHWWRDIPSDSSNYDSYSLFIDELKTKIQFGDKMIDVEFFQFIVAGESEITCSVNKNSEEGVVQLCLQDGENGITFGTCPDFDIALPRYYIYSPDKKLSELSD